MLKRTQNKVAESRFTLSVVVAYAIAIWLVSGMLIPQLPLTTEGIRQGAWIPFVCFMVSAYLMVELNNSNALIRIYSRTVSCSFIVLICSASFLFNSLAGSIVQLCLIAFFICFFRCYQDRQSMGWTFYAFLSIGLASTVFIQALFYVPFLWIMMFYRLSSLNWRTFSASIVGLITPYWFAVPWFIYQGDPEPLFQHLVSIIDFQFSYDYHQFTVNQLLLLVFVLALGITGIVHYLRRQSADGIRIRLLYRCFIQIWFITTFFIFLQPQHYDMLIRILIISTSPLIAHFLSLTYTRITNIAFYVICATAFIMAVFNLWMPSLTF